MAGFRSKTNKPSNLPEWNGTIIDPGAAKKTVGWLDEEVVPHQWLNWLFNLIYRMTKYLRVRGEDASAEDFIVSQTSPTSSVLIGAGRIRQFDKSLDVAEQTFAWPTLAPTPTGDRRVDVLVLNALGIPVVIAGTEVTNPALPVAPPYAGAFPVAEILLNGSAGGTPNIVQRDIVSITRIGAIATVTTATAHGLVGSDAIYLFGADQPEYNGLFNVSAVTTFAFGVTVAGTPATPATGTMIATTIRDVRGFLVKDLGTLEGAVDVAVVQRFDLSDSLAPLVNVVHPWSAPVKLANPTTLPPNAAGAVAWSPGREFLAVSHDASPFISIYQRNGTVFTRLANPAILPTNFSIAGMAWSLNGEFLSIPHNLSPFVTIYQRDGNTFTKLANLSPPPGASVRTAWSPNGEFLAVTHVAAPYLTIYQRSGTAFTPLTPPGTPPGSNTAGVAWSSNGKFLIVGHGIPPYVTIYRQNGTTFTALAAPAVPPTYPVTGVAWSPNDEFLVLTHAAAPYLTIYQRSGTTFAHITNPVSLPSGSVVNASWSPNGKHLAVTDFSSPYLLIYERNLTTFTALVPPAVLPTGNAFDIEWSKDGQYLAVAHINSPYFTVYQTTGVFPSEFVVLRTLAPVLD